LSTITEVRLDALLFGETQNRIVISTSAVEAGKVIAQAKALNVPAIKLGTIGGDRLVVKAAQGEWSWELPKLHDLWFNSIARLMA
jgi:phosphoribosylformylglycinamidine synthase